MTHASRRRIRPGHRPPAGWLPDGWLPDGWLPDGWLLGLLLPADPRRPCAVLALRDAAADLSDAIGGGLLDEQLVDGEPGQRCCVYLDEGRRARDLPPNRRLERLAARLGWPHLDGAGPLGPALVTGLDPHGADLDVPPAVLAAALREGLTF